MRLTLLCRLAAGMIMVIGMPYYQCAFADIIYTQTNPAGPNAVAVFNQDVSTGHLTLKATYLTGGIGNPNFSGCSQDTIVTDGEFLYVTNVGSNDISVFEIGDNGVLRLVGKPVPSGGVTPVTLAVMNGILYVGNQGDGATVAANYTGFFADEGKLTAIPDSTVQLNISPAPGPGDLRFALNGKLLIGTRVSDNAIDVFRVTGRGTLERTTQVTSPHPFGVEFNPVRPEQLIVASEALPGSISFAVSRKGQIRFLHEAQDNPAVDSCWIQIRRDGAFVWLAGFFGQSVVLHHLDPDGVLQPISLHTTAPFGQFTSDILLDRRQKYMYALLPGTGQIHVMRVTGETTDGGLSDVDTFALPANSFPQGLVVIADDDSDDE